MQLLEFQGKQLLRESGIATPAGQLCRSGAESFAAASEVGGQVVVKAQILSGHRGKSGAVQPADDPDDARRRAESLLGRTVGDLRIDSVLVEQRVAIAHEFYAAILNDPESKKPLVLFSLEGGVDIEEVTAHRPDALVRTPVDIAQGFDVAAADRLLSGLGRPVPSKTALAATLTALYALYRQVDADLVEVNPLVVNATGDVIALDCKLSLDPSGLARHPQLRERCEADLPNTSTALEARAREAGLLYVQMDGDVGVLANGAGLTMATLDAVHHYGGRPANFLEIGGDAYTKAVAALSIVLGNPRVTSMLVNFCGAFARTDVMAEGVVAAIEQLQPTVPFSFSIHGTGEAAAVALVKQRLGIDPHDLMDDAVHEAVRNAAAAKEVATDAGERR